MSEVPDVSVTGLVKGAPQADPNLEAEGWRRRYLADPDRTEEAKEIYESLGLEVRIERLTPQDFGSECGTCPETVCKTYVLIYTRKSD